MVHYYFFFLPFFARLITQVNLIVVVVRYLSVMHMSKSDSSSSASIFRVLFSGGGYGGAHYDALLPILDNIASPQLFPSPISCSSSSSISSSSSSISTSASSFSRVSSSYSTVSATSSGSAILPIL